MASIMFYFEEHFGRNALGFACKKPGRSYDGGFFFHVHIKGKARNAVFNYGSDSTRNTLVRRLLFIV